MADILATDEWRIVVPLRFRRFNHGALPVINAPEIDDRGFVKGTRPGPWGDTTVRGPSFGVMVENTVHVRVLREDIDAGAPLVATSSDEAVLRIATPAGIIAADGDLEVEGVASGSARLEIRLGDSVGPILGEADVRVHSRLRVALTPHLVRIDTTTATGTAPVMDVDLMVRRLRAIWRPCGIDFTVRATVNESTRLPSNRLNFFDFEAPGFAETNALLGLQRTRLAIPAGTRDQSINWYIIREFVPDAAGNATVGLGVDRRTADSWGVTDTGVVVASHAFGNPRDAEFTARTLAHEIGHFFRLNHVQNRDAGNPVRDTFGRRQLMYPLSRIQDGTGGFSLPRFNNVGYGDTVRGCLLTMKNLDHHSTDGECATARNAIHAGTWT